MREVWAIEKKLHQGERLDPQESEKLEKKTELESQLSKMESQFLKRGKKVESESKKVESEPSKKVQLAEPQLVSEAQSLTGEERLEAQPLTGEERLEIVRQQLERLGIAQQQPEEWETVDAKKIEMDIDAKKIEMDNSIETAALQSESETELDSDQQHQVHHPAGLQFESHIAQVAHQQQYQDRPALSEPWYHTSHCGIECQEHSPRDGGSSSDSNSSASLPCWEGDSSWGKENNNSFSQPALDKSPRSKWSRILATSEEKVLLLPATGASSKAAAPSGPPFDVVPRKKGVASAGPHGPPRSKAGPPPAGPPPCVPPPCVPGNNTVTKASAGTSSPFWPPGSKACAPKSPPRSKACAPKSPLVLTYSNNAESSNNLLNNAEVNKEEGSPSKTSNGGSDGESRQAPFFDTSLWSNLKELCVNAGCDGFTVPHDYDQNPEHRAFWLRHRVQFVVNGQLIQDEDSETLSKILRKHMNQMEKKKTQISNLLTRNQSPFLSLKDSSPTVGVISISESPISESRNMIEGMEEGRYEVLSIKPQTKVEMMPVIHKDFPLFDPSETITLPQVQRNRLESEFLRSNRRHERWNTERWTEEKMTIGLSPLLNVSNEFIASMFRTDPQEQQEPETTALRTALDIIQEMRKMRSDQEMIHYVSQTLGMHEISNFGGSYDEPGSSYEPGGKAPGAKGLYLPSFTFSTTQEMLIYGQRPGVVSNSVKVPCLVLKHQSPISMSSKQSSSKQNSPVRNSNHLLQEAIKALQSKKIEVTTLKSAAGGEVKGLYLVRLDQPFFQKCLESEYQTDGSPGSSKFGKHSMFGNNSSRSSRSFNSHDQFWWHRDDNTQTVADCVGRYNIAHLFVPYNYYLSNAVGVEPNRFENAELDSDIGRGIYGQDPNYRDGSLDGQHRRLKVSVKRHLSFNPESLQEDSRYSGQEGSLYLSGNDSSPDLLAKPIDLRSVWSIAIVAGNGPNVNGHLNSMPREIITFGHVSESDLDNNASADPSSNPDNNIGILGGSGLNPYTDQHGHVREKTEETEDCDERNSQSQDWQEKLSLSSLVTKASRNGNRSNSRVGRFRKNHRTCRGKKKVTPIVIPSGPAFQPTEIWNSFGPVSSNSDSEDWDKRDADGEKRRSSRNAERSRNAEQSEPRKKRRPSKKKRDASKRRMSMGDGQNTEATTTTRAASRAKSRSKSREKSRDKKQASSTSRNEKPETKTVIIYPSFDEENGFSMGRVSSESWLEEGLQEKFGILEIARKRSEKTTFFRLE